MAWPGISRAKQIAQECPPLSDLVPPDSGDQGHRRRDDLSESGSACLDIGSGDHASPVYGEHSVILTSQRCPFYTQQENITSSCHTRRHPWERLRLSRLRRFVQENNGTPCASSSMHALTNGSIPSNSSGMSRRHLSWRGPQRCWLCASHSPGRSPGGSWRMSTVVNTTASSSPVPGVVRC